MVMIKKIYRRIIDFFKSGTDRSVITICFLVSLLFWVLIKFSKEYTYYVDYPVSYVNHPIDKYLKTPPNSSIKVKVKAFGFNYLKEWFSSKNLNIDVPSLQKYAKADVYYGLTDVHRPEITKELNGFSILDIDPDTLFLNYSQKTKKTVPIEVPQNLSLRDNFMQYGSFKIIPNEIEVFGPSHILEALSSVSTEELVREDVFEDVKAKLRVVLPDEFLSTRDETVEVIQEVERFTQINKVIPIKIKNSPRGVNAIVKPPSVELSYWIAMQDVEKVTNSDFEIYCDYNESSMTQSDVLNVFIGKTPSVVSRVKYAPKTIELIK